MENNIVYNEKTEYLSLTDEELILIFRNGNDDAMDFLMEKYKGLVRKKARTLFLIGGDTDDLIQEGMIGLYKAVRDFNVEKQASFHTFANLCIERQIYTAINMSNRKKHLPLNSYITFGMEEGKDGENQDFMPEEAVDKLSNPETLYIDKENVEYIQKALEKELSKLEFKVLLMYIDGMGYQEIAQMMNKKPKSIDNAIQRIKQKVSRIVDSMEV